MVCSDCVWKLALRLVENHPGLDLIFALERAYKGMERHGKEDPPPLCDDLTAPDYVQTAPGSCDCFVGNPCSSDAQCINDLCTNPCDTSPCSEVCPAPLANSHNCRTITCIDSSTCYMYGLNRTCDCYRYPWGRYCIGTCVCQCSYKCDDGYEWNGSACVEIAAAKKPIGDGLVFVT